MATSTATATTTAPSGMTVEEFVRRPDPGEWEELVHGRIVRLNPPKPYHGWVCSNVAMLIGPHVKANDLGYTMANDSGVITARNPDTIRGADFAFYSYARVPKGTLSETSYLNVVPDLIIEVLSAGDRWSEALAKVAEYLKAGVAVVGVLDPQRRTMHLFEGEEPVRILGEGDELALPGLLGEFRVVIRAFFE